MRCAVLAAATLAAVQLAAGDSIELTDAAKVKEKFAKGKLRLQAVLGYLPTPDDVKVYQEVAKQFANQIDFYHVSDRQALEALGMQSRELRTMITVFRPWYPGKNYKATYRQRITGVATNKARVRDWLLTEALEPLGLTHGKLINTYDKASARLKKPRFTFFINSKIDDPDLKKPDDWEQPQKILDPEAKAPDDWDEEEDGAFVADEIPNPAFKGEWRASKKSTLIDDPEESKPDDWDQPATMPDPKGMKPDDWDEEEDGPWEPPPEIPNPAFKGEWKATKIMPPDAYKRILDVVKPIWEKYQKKLLFTIEDVSGEMAGTPQGRANKFAGFAAPNRTWSDIDYAAGRVIAIEEKKFTTLKYDNEDFGAISDYKASEGKKFAFRGDDGYAPGAVMEWVDKWAAKKLVDETKMQREEGKKKAEEEKKKKKEMEKQKKEDEKMMKKKEEEEKLEL